MQELTQTPWHLNDWDGSRNKFRFWPEPGSAAIFDYLPVTPAAKWGRAFEWVTPKQSQKFIVEPFLGGRQSN